jgi:hypothetical protein
MLGRKHGLRVAAVPAAPLLTACGRGDKGYAGPGRGTGFQAEQGTGGKLALPLAVMSRDLAEIRAWLFAGDPGFHNRLCPGLRVRRYRDAVGVFWPILRELLWSWHD